MKWFAAVDKREVLCAGIKETNLNKVFESTGGRY